MEKLVITNITKAELNPEHWGQLEKIFKTILFLKEDSPNLIEEIADADAIFSKFNPISAELLSKAKILKYIGVFATGYGKVDLSVTSKRGITVTNIPGYSTESVAEFSISIILEQLRTLHKARVQTAKDNYSEDGYFASEIKGKAFGVVGLGQIGTRVAELASAFNADVIYSSRKDKNIPFAKFVELETLVSSCDIISLHTELSDQTDELLNSSLIEKLKPGTILVNTSPMELIDFKALLKRLSKGDITFIWDHPDEMSSDKLARLTKFENCITYPPIGYITEEASAAKKDIFIKNIQSFVEGGSLNSVNK